jgi:hypothetical protein
MPQRTPGSVDTVDASSAVDAHVVTACNALGAAGVWQLVTPPQIPIVTDDPIGNFGNGSAGMTSVKVDPHDPSIVYAMGGHRHAAAPAPTASSSPPTAAPRGTSSTRAATERASTPGGSGTAASSSIRPTRK